MRLLSILYPSRRTLAEHEARIARLEHELAALRRSK